MKVLCPTCGLHWEEDFEETLEDNCQLWRSRGFPSTFKTSPEMIPLLKELWKAYFSIDFDRYSEKYGVVVSGGALNFYSYSDKDSSGQTINWYEENVPGYKEWDDAKRRRFQKASYRGKFSREEGEKRYRAEVIEFSKDFEK